MSVIGISLAETNLAERPSHSQRERERERRVRTLVSSHQAESRPQLARKAEQ